jgi:hypothetical protein
MKHGRQVSHFALFPPTSGLAERSELLIDDPAIERHSLLAGEEGRSRS